MSRSGIRGDEEGDSAMGEGGEVDWSVNEIEANAGRKVGSSL